jgi:ATP-dependent metalloprotease
MDGFEKTENIMIIGATNHEDALDPAAVRPGRFDKKIHVPLPDVNGREDIFNFYLGQIEKGEDI